jgi:hypothetical protein
LPVLARSLGRAGATLVAVDELAEHRRRRREDRDEALRRLGLHPPTLLGDEQLRHYGDRPAGTVELIAVERGLRSDEPG